MEQTSGIYFNTQYQKWCATARVGGKRHHVGYYDTREEAAIEQQLFHDQFNLSTKHINYNILAKDPTAWKAKAQDIVKQLSKEYGVGV